MRLDPLQWHLEKSSLHDCDAFALTWICDFFSKRTTTEKHLNTLNQNTVLAEAGGLQKIRIACGIYLVDILFGVFIFIKTLDFWNF